MLLTIKNINLLLLALCMIFVTRAQVCPLSGNLPNFAIDGFTIGNGFSVTTPTGNQIKCYTQNFPSAFTSVPSIGIALTGFDTTITSDLFISIRPMPTTNLSTATYAIRTFARLGHWVKVSVTTIAESRSDLEVVEGHIESLYASGCAPTNLSSTSTLATRDNWAAKKDAVARVFVSGFLLSSGATGQLDIKLLNPSVGVRTVSATLYTQSQVSGVSVTFVIFDTSVYGFDSSSPISMTQLQGNLFIPVSPNFRYTLFGLSGFTLQSQQTTSVSIAYNQGVISLSSVTLVSSVEAYYLQLGRTVSETKGCRDCRGYTFANGNTCVATCPPPSRGFNNVCITCGLNSVLNSVGVCVCAAGFVKIGDACSQCPTGTQYNSATLSCQIICPLNSSPDATFTSCNCNPGFVRLQSGCAQCPTGTQYNAATQTCQIVCPVNSSPDATFTTCNCNTGFVRLQSGCGQCPAGTQYNSLTLTCQIVCPINSSPDATFTTCNCNSGFFRIQGVCAQCSVGTQYNPSTQTCQIVCPVNASPDVTFTSCNCNPGFFKIGDSCSVCPANTIYDLSTFSCTALLLCPPFSSIDIITNRCVCDPGYTNISSACVSTSCPTNQIFTGGLCSCLPELNLIAGFCATCPVGYTYNNGVCFLPDTTVCPANSTYDPSVLKCLCLTGYVVINGACGKCPEGTTYDGNNCLPSGNGIPCPLGSNCQIFCTTFQNTVFNQSSFSCVCSAGNYNISGTCKSCGLNQVFINGACVNDVNSLCAAGTFFDSMEKKCLNCPDGCAKCNNALECQVCANGWSKAANKKLCSEVCGDGIRFTVECDDGNTKNGDGCSSRCKIQSGYTCQGGSVNSKDFCTTTRPSAISLTASGQSHLYQKIAANVRVNWLPKNLTVNPPNNVKVLIVNVTSGNDTPSITATYLPGTSYSFSIVFDFGKQPIADFNAAVQVNPALADYFPGIDISSVLILKLVPSQMAKPLKTDTLKLPGLGEDN